jgi:hypothetical protein
MPLCYRLMSPDTALGATNDGRQSPAAWMRVENNRAYCLRLLSLILVSICLTY